MIDIYHSRRNKFKLCMYWKRDERVSVGDLNQWVLKNKPTGSFYAQETSTLNKANGQLNNVIEFNTLNINIVTNDDIKDIQQNDIVSYLGHIWFVEGVQQEIHNKETEFSNTIEATTYLSLTR